MATRPILTNRRRTWAESRSEAPTFNGTVLQNNAAVESRYVRALSGITAQMTAQVTREIVKLFKSETGSEYFAQDATIASQSRILMSALGSKFNDLFAKKARPLAETMATQAERASSPALHASLQKLSGGMSLKTTGIPTGLGEIYKAAVAENVSLIKSISTQYLQQVEGAVMRSITSGAGLQDLVPALQKYEGMTHRRARNIALDQTRKTYNAINRGRMEAIGVRQFMWHHSGGGAHPREDHIEMDGKIYSFDDLPVIDRRTGERGIPGQAPNCRCTMSPVFQFEPKEPES
jgi:SPP1 gp7 family putative phage head morphogenesis protein